MFVTREPHHCLKREGSLLLFLATAISCTGIIIRVLPRSNNDDDVKPGVHMSSDIDELQEVLRRSGQRMTPQRMMVLSALSEHEGHITAETILDLVRPDYPYINLSTVYRTLDLLIELGLVAETDLGGGVRQFELMGSRPHHHLICQRCGSTIEIGDETLQPLRERLQTRYDFEPRMDHFAIFGICHQCREQESVSATGH